MKKNPLVGIVVGSTSDLVTILEAQNILEIDFGIKTELEVVSAHRTPLRMVKYAQTARERGLSVIIAGAGGAAHLPGMIASLTTLPVIGVPINSRNSFHGLDSILSILQMPRGVPVATMALDGAENAGVMAAEIIGIWDDDVASNLDKYKKKLEKQVPPKEEQP